MHSSRALHALSARPTRALHLFQQPPGTPSCGSGILCPSHPCPKSSFVKRAQRTVSELNKKVTEIGSLILALK